MEPCAFGPSGHLVHEGRHLFHQDLPVAADQPRALGGFEAAAQILAGVGLRVARRQEGGGDLSAKRKLTIPFLKLFLEEKP